LKINAEKNQCFDKPVNLSEKRGIYSAIV